MAGTPAIYDMTAKDLIEGTIAAGRRGVNVPIIAVALIAGYVLLPKSKDPAPERLDPIGALLSIAGLASASPLDTRQTGTITPPASYYLRTKVVNGAHKDTGSNKTGLYVYSYHTGAGLGDAALSRNKTVAWQGHLNGTQQLMTYSGNKDSPWPLSVYDVPYQEWNKVTISISEIPVYNAGFFFNSSGLQYNGTTGGWLACDWWHGVPQLFQVNGYLNNGFGVTGLQTPSSCSRIQLQPIAV